MSQAAIGSQSNIKNALHGIEQTKGLERFFYGLCLFFGIVFFGIGIITAFGVVSRIITQGTDTASMLLIILFSGYVVNNFILGSGLVFCRKWLLVAFFGNTILLVSTAAILFMKGDSVQAESLFFGICLSSIFLLFLSVGRKFLVGRYFEPRVLFPFFILLLVSFFINVLYLIY